MSEKIVENIKSLRDQLQEIDELIESLGEDAETLELKKELLILIEEEEKKLEIPGNELPKDLLMTSIPTKTKPTEKRSVTLEDRLKRPLDVKLYEEIKRKQVYLTQGGYEIPNSLKIQEGDNVYVQTEKKRKINQIKQMQSNDRIDEDTCKKANDWQKFLKKGMKKNYIREASAATVTQQKTEQERPKRRRFN